MEEKPVQKPVQKPVIINPALEVNLPKIYFNGFKAGAGNADVVTILELNGRPIAILNSSFTLTKTLAQQLTTLVESIEKDSGNPIMTTSVVDEAFKKSKDAK
jgi:hypothetical protein